jgi:hypothetical protein
MSIAYVQTWLARMAQPRLYDVVTMRASLVVFEDFWPELGVLLDNVITDRLNKQYADQLVDLVSTTVGEFHGMNHKKSTTRT